MQNERREREREANFSNDFLIFMHILSFRAQNWIYKTNGYTVCIKTKSFIKFSNNFVVVTVVLLNFGAFQYISCKYDNEWSCATSAKPTQPNEIRVQSVFLSFLNFCLERLFPFSYFTFYFLYVKKVAIFDTRSLNVQKTKLNRFTKKIDWENKSNINLEE